MSMILDILVLAVFIVTVVFYAKKGMVRSLLGVGGFLFALAFALLLCRAAGKLIAPVIADAVDGIETGDSLINSVLDKVLHSDQVATVLAFGILFLLGLLLFKLLSVLISSVFELPVLSEVNHIGGALIGAVLGLLYAWVLSLFLFCFSEYLIGAFDWLTAESYESSVIAKWLFRTNLFRFVLDLAK